VCFYPFKLDAVTKLKLCPTRTRPLSIDESGDFIAWSLSIPTGRKISGRQQVSAPPINGATYGTFFDLKRAYTLPDVDFTGTRRTPPPQPQPVSLGPHSFLGGLGAWLPFKQTLSGEEIDELRE
jgi:syntaxin-binding protein 5